MTILGTFNWLAFLMLIISMVDIMLKTTGRGTEMIKLFLFFPTFFYASSARPILGLSRTGSFCLNFVIGGFSSMFLFYFFYALLSLSFLVCQYIEEKQHEKK